ncbi:MAG: hypoxanthine phosphoribosyltransferase [Nitrospirae bacterium GWC2_46_6]|nr:MAG: hypoxanthine phosphoribosyltransferase [Nitrospirae bacterium GWC2_46_6]OGW22483.1 MAG: hypoxanthine phosphoribosyltransferase [Nitrospirae bacterium GWA2_46_11]OGW25381.1 MAG: hypoxanthine phosphoribosyltransferase [Nitrospirae bacterium GWB2_47_37]HAK87838.1 hypoxanthine phosphoribosyltransferase [Nitrospiraceae bacterium]HCZ12429.1 hypoxanthine phosphoribosyltransferase [Nitrospiraceae bacterium]
MITGKPFLTTEQIHEKVIELADRISKDYSGKEILAIGILKGSFMFFADLIRALKTPVTLDFIIAASYLKTTSTGEIKIHYDIREEVKGKHVLLIDDIIDTGISLNYIRERILSKGPASLKICTLLDKKERRETDVPMDYIGFEIPNQFFVGYGLDYDNNYRNLPYIAVFKKET